MSVDGVDFDLEFLRSVSRLLRARRELLENSRRFEELLGFSEPPQGHFDVNGLKAGLTELQQLLLQRKIIAETLSSINNNLKAVEEADLALVSDDVLQLVQENTSSARLAMNTAVTEDMEAKYLRFKVNYINLTAETKTVIADKRSLPELNRPEDDTMAKMTRNLKKLNLTRKLSQGLIAGFLPDSSMVQELEQPRRDLTFDDFIDTMNNKIK